MKTAEEYFVYYNKAEDKEFALKEIINEFFREMIEITDNVKISPKSNLLFSYFFILEEQNVKWQIFSKLIKIPENGFELIIRKTSSNLYREWKIWRKYKKTGGVE